MSLSELCGLSICLLGTLLCSGSHCILFGLWKENDKEIKIEKDKLSKVRDIPMPTKKYERNYLAKQTTANARIWFRYRSKIISDIKGNQSSKWTGHMQCRQYGFITVI